MTSKKNIKNIIPGKPENPFVVPEGYFAGLEERLMNRIRSGEEAGEKPGAAETDQATKRVSLRPYLTLAASMSGIALIIYILLQTVVGSRLDEYGYYDMAVLDQAGVTYDEAIISETYSMDEQSIYSDWDRDAMVYLSSNEVDLLHLLDEN